MTHSRSALSLLLLLNMFRRFNLSSQDQHFVINKIEGIKQFEAKPGVTDRSKLLAELSPAVRADCVQRAMTVLTVNCRMTRSRTTVAPDVRRRHRTRIWSQQSLIAVMKTSESRRHSHLQLRTHDSSDETSSEGEEDEQEEEEEEGIDPRIEEKLEELNEWTESINDLEKCFEEANASFRSYLTDYSDKLKAFAEKVGSKSVRRARVYYEAKERASAAQTECQQTVMRYEQACRMHVQARDEIQQTEDRFQSAGSPEFDVSWQELLNQSTQKLRAAEEMKADSKERHEKSMKEFVAAEECVHRLGKKLRSAIHKSGPYFQESAKFKLHLITIKQQIEELNKKIIASKRCYAITLKDLERISEEIHARRSFRLKALDMKRHAIPEDDFSYHSLVPELNVTSARFQLEVRPRTLAFLSPDLSCSSSSSTCDQGIPDEASPAELSQLSVNGFDEVELD